MEKKRIERNRKQREYRDQEKNISFDDNPKELPNIFKSRVHKHRALKKLKDNLPTPTKCIKRVSRKLLNVCNCHNLPETKDIDTRPNYPTILLKNKF